MGTGIISGAYYKLLSPFGYASVLFESMLGGAIGGLQCYSRYNNAQNNKSAQPSNGTQADVTIKTAAPYIVSAIHAYSLYITGVIPGLSSF